MFVARVFTLYPEFFPGPLGKGLYGKALDEKISTDLLTQLKNSREIIRQRTKGISDIKKLQQELINYMRRNFHRTSFTKSEAINLIRKIQQVNSKSSQANLENLMEEVMAEINIYSR